jgi:hypothetical protein
MAHRVCVFFILGLHRLEACFSRCVLIEESRGKSRPGRQVPAPRRRLKPMSTYLDTIDYPRMNLQDEAPEHGTTVLLRQWSAGHDEAFGQLLPLACDSPEDDCGRLYAPPNLRADSSAHVFDRRAGFVPIPQEKRALAGSRALLSFLRPRHARDSARPCTVPGSKPRSLGPAHRVV